ncbi:50S ribosomal protein L32e [Candidatus Woesearchaeota archaeon]|nr:50S ribosomal protein L32e [Candidatus Woesearchaeota archaeon]
MDLLKIRKEMKAKKPEFTAQDSHKAGRVQKKYRRPKGIHSKIRMGWKSYKKKIKVGYKSPCAVRGLSVQGLIPVVVANAAAVRAIDPGIQGAVISSSVGMKRREELIRLLVEKKVIILNIRDPEKKLKEIGAGLKEKREKRTMREASKKEKEKDLKKKAEEKSKEEKKEGVEEIVDEDKKMQEKRDMDKLLTKKDSV